MRIKEQQIINIQAYKHDGVLYRQWNGVKVIEINSKWWIAISNKTKVIENKGQRWKVNDPMIWFFPLNKKFFNVIVSIRENGINYYTNIASPAIFEDNVIKFIDYDIDIKLYPGKKMKIMDESEYKINKKKFNYSEKLDKKIMNTTANISQMIKDKKEYFDQNCIISYLKKLVKSKDFSKKILKVKRLIKDTK